MTKIAYVMSRFPHLPETFILREMNEMEQLGWTVVLCPIVYQEQATVHEEAAPWLARAWALPLLSLAILAANGRFFLTQPLRYLTIWLRTLGENWRCPPFLLRGVALLPKAVYAAARMQTEKVQHVHAHYASHPALFAWIVHQLTGIPFSVTVHAHDIFVRTPMLHTKLQDAAFIAAISEYNRDHLAQLLGDWVREKVHIVRCGIDPAAYTPRPPHRRRDRLDMINVGSLQPYKGQQYLIEACALLRRRGIPIRCRIIGEGEERPFLQKLIVRYGLETAVTLLGAQTQQEVARLLPTANCYVQPSVRTPAGKMEGIPVALMEAMACRLPVVATRLSGIPELVRPGETGLLAPPRSARALADALMDIYEDPQRAFALAENGRQRVLKTHRLSTNVAHLSQLLTQSHHQHADASAAWPTRSAPAD